jgi:type 1 fimbria pilin
VSGVGYISYISGGGFNVPVTMDSTWKASAGPGGVNPTFQTGLFVTVKLVVTGPVSSGPLSVNPNGGSGIQNQIGAFYVNPNGTRLFKVVLAANSTAIVASACKVTMPSIAVELPAVSSRTLSKVGTTAGAQSTSIDLTCPLSTRVFITLTDSAKPTNTSNILTLKPDATAQGVGLQILNANGPVSYGADSSVADNKNQWLVGTSSGGVLKIPLTVRYIQTAASVRPRTVNGVATFTMSYH